MGWGRPYRYAVTATSRRDGQLSIVRVERSWKGPDVIVFSDGQQVISRWERLTTQCEWHCQQQTAIHPRLWETKEGVELVTLQPLPEREVGSAQEAF